MTKILHVCKIHLNHCVYCLSNAILTDYITSTIVFYRTRVYQMQPRNDQNWHASVGKYVHYNRKTAKIGFLHISKISYYFGFR